MTNDDDDVPALSLLNPYIGFYTPESSNYKVHRNFPQLPGKLPLTLWLQTQETFPQLVFT